MRLTATDDYLDFIGGVKTLTSIDLTQYKRGQMERRIRTFAQRRGMPDLAEYLVALRREPEELDTFLDRMTINVSQLWRNPEQWTTIATQLLPELAAGGRSIGAWSAGCSYGAEAYTLAAVARERVRTRVTVRGTDIDRRVVERARHGHFTTEDARTAPADVLGRHFTRDDAGWQASAALVAMCRFEVGDLLAMPVRAAAHDLILCRNTVIYFTDEVRDALHRKLARALRPGGYLVIGSTERVHEPRSMDLVPTHPFVYRKA